MIYWFDQSSWNWWSYLSNERGVCFKTVCHAPTPQVYASTRITQSSLGKTPKGKVVFLWSSTLVWQKGCLHYSNLWPSNHEGAILLLLPSLPSTIVQFIRNIQFELLIVWIWTISTFNGAIHLIMVRQEGSLPSYGIYLIISWLEFNFL